VTRASDAKHSSRPSTAVKDHERLATYWDGSGCETDQSPDSVFVLGGFIGDQENWREFEPRWKAKLWDPYRLKCYHATDLEHLSRECPEDWPASRLLELQKDLARVLFESRFHERSFAVSVTRNVFDAVAEKYVLERRGVEGRYVLAGLGLLSLIYQKRNLHGRLAESRLSVYLEAGDTGQGRLIRLLRRENRDGKIGTTIVDIPKARFIEAGRMECLAPFEAADFLTYEVRKARELLERGAPESEWRGAGLACNEWLRTAVAVMDVDYLTRLCEQAKIDRREPGT
jgi:hypothetical protein